MFLLQKQPSKVFCKKSCSQKFLNLRRKIPVLESHYNSRSLQAYNFIKTRIQHRFFPVNIAKFLRAPISKNSAGGSFSFLLIRHLHYLFYSLPALYQKLFLCRYIQLSKPMNFYISVDQYLVDFWISTEISVVGFWISAEISVVGFWFREMLKNVIFLSID